MWACNDLKCMIMNKTYKRLYSIHTSQYNAHATITRNHSEQYTQHSHNNDTPQTTSTSRDTTHSTMRWHTSHKHARRFTVTLNNAYEPLHACITYPQKLSLTRSLSAWMHVCPFVSSMVNRMYICAFVLVYGDF
eukprot:m.292690 g.292690  ORF g.292690 m.292690 type:complete len:134 (-) comp20007_c0_seq2:1555-1956(-)